MNTRNQHNDFAAIEEHIRRARLQRAVTVSNLLAGAIMAAVEALRRFAPASRPAGQAPRPAAKPLVVKARLATPART